DDQGHGDAPEDAVVLPPVVVLAVVLLDVELLEALAPEPPPKSGVGTRYVPLASSGAAPGTR
ncbi:MAG TPA: hypothetical protein VLQ79_06910, partial [Myxococcaceae bacterium]|nr:hypothetical protein [Myxococcaceae bacterium]